MAVNYFEVSGETNEIRGQVIWEKQITASVPGTTTPILLPADAGRIENILVAVIISGTGSLAEVQTTISPYAEVIAGRANWLSWDAGQVDASASDVLYPVTAIRFIAHEVSNPVIFEARAL